MLNTELETEFNNLYGPFFSYNEFICKCDHCGDRRRKDIASGHWFRAPEFTAFMLVLIDLRTEAGFPFVINSGYRCPDYNDSIYVLRGSEPGRHLTGPHTIGAVDIAVTHERAYRLNQLASAKNLGLGPNQAGNLAKRFFHVDNGGPRLWTYL